MLQRLVSMYLHLFNWQANVTDELEERIEVLEQEVEDLENEDALINARLFDIEMDIFDNENAIEGKYTPLEPYLDNLFSVLF